MRLKFFSCFFSWEVSFFVNCFSCIFLFLFKSIEVPYKFWISLFYQLQILSSVGHLLFNLICSVYSFTGILNYQIVNVTEFFFMNWALVLKTPLQTDFVFASAGGHMPTTV